MAFNMNAAKLSINTAIEYSICGKENEALNEFSNFALNENQTKAIGGLLKEVNGKTSPQQCMRQRVQILSILVSTPPQKTCVKPVVESKGYNWVTVKINFLKKEVDKNTTIMNVPSRDLLERKKVNVRCYNNFNKLMSDFNFSTNGIEYCEIKGEFLKSLVSFPKNPSDEDLLNLSEPGLNFISSWAKKKGIDFDFIQPLGFSYRNSDPNANTGMKPYHLAHIDFQKKDIPEFMEQKDTVIRIVEAVNLWTPLDSEQTKDTLGLLDKTSMDLSECVSYKDPNDAIASQSLKASDRHNWITCCAMTLGTGVVFPSRETAHSAIRLEEGIKYRRSLESRYLLGRYERKV